MKTIGQRELRNDNARVIRDIEDGETYTVTRRGVPVAQIGPVRDDAGLGMARPARNPYDPASLPRVRSALPTSETLDGLRSER